MPKIHTAMVTYAELINPHAFDEQAAALAQTVPFSNVLALGHSAFAPNSLA